MTGYLRYFPAEPPRAVLRAIEGVNLIERPPTSIPEGAGTGVVCIVGEFEDGAFDSPTEVRKKTDFLNTFGGFGFQKAGVPYAHPVARRSGSSELWNGNGYLALRGKKHNRLIVVRVNNSAGTVTFRRLASLTSTVRGPHDLEPGDTFATEVDGGAVVATINAQEARLDAAGGVFPSTFVGGEFIIIQDEFGNLRTVTFTAADQSIAQVIAAFNAQLAYTAASNNAGQIRLSSRIRGAKGYIKIAGGTASAITQLGFTTTVTAEVDVVTVVVANNGVYTFTVAVWTAGVITTYTGTYTHAAAETVTQTRDALLSNFNTVNPTAPVTLATSGAGAINITSNVAGVPLTTTITATPNPGDFTTGNVTPNSTSYALGTGNVQDIDAVTDAEIVTIVDALAGISAVLLSTGYIRFANTTTPETGTLEITGGAVATALGFTAGDSSIASSGEEITIPAGTLIRDTAGYLWLTLRTATTDETGGPFDFPVRPAVDDDTTPSAGIGTATTLVDTLEDAFAVTNAALLQRLSPAGFDAAYARAIAATEASSDEVVKEINIIYAARTSASITQSLISNVEITRAEEHALRVGIFSSPIGTSVDDMISDTSIGVLAAGRRNTMFYRSPGVLVPVPEIAALGAAGGLGFNDDGIIQQRFDCWYASIRSQLNPEENAGQDLTRTIVGRLGILGLEEIFNSKYGGTALESGDYIAFKAAGIGAPKMDPQAGCTIQSDVTCQPESEDSERSQANYRFMFDYLGTSLRLLAGPYVKTLVKPVNNGGVVEAFNGFLADLKSESDPNLARIRDFDVSDQTTESGAAVGDRDIQVEVSMLQTQKYINIRLTVGTSVEIQSA